MLNFDFGLFALGVGGMTAAAVLTLRRYPDERIDRRRRHSGFTTSGFGLLSFFVAVVGGSSAERHLGWWVLAVAFAAFAAARELPQQLHNRDVDRRSAQAAEIF